MLGCVPFFCLRENRNMPTVYTQKFKQRVPTFGGRSSPGHTVLVVVGCLSWLVRSVESHRIRCEGWAETGHAGGEPGETTGEREEAATGIVGKSWAATGG